MESRRPSRVRLIYFSWPYELNDVDRTAIDLQNLLVSVGALKATDHRVLGPARGDGEQKYNSIRTGKLNGAAAEEEDDDWD